MSLLVCPFDAPRPVAVHVSVSANDVLVREAMKGSNHLVRGMLVHRFGYLAGCTNMWNSSFYLDSKANKGYALAIYHYKKEIRSVE